MKAHVYCVRDDLSGFQPMAFIFNSHEIAKRNLMQTLFAGEPNAIEKDLAVYYLADIDLDTGEVLPVDKEQVLNGAAIHTKKLSKELI